MLKPDEMFFRSLHRIEPGGSDLCIHVPIVPPQEEDERD
jgi:hypothetical protein